MKTLYKNKKAFSYKMLDYTFLRLAFIVIFFYTIYAFASYGTKTTLDIQKTKDLIFIERTVYSPSSFSYTDQITKRSYPGIIDSKRFDCEVIDKALNYSKNDIAAKFKLTNLDSNETKEIYFNKKWYDRWEPLTKFEQYNKEAKQRYVLIKNEGNLSKGLLEFEVVSSNE